jgi:hypothetical protein
LRKWILPGLSGPLLLIRDPVALYIIVLAITERVMPRNAFLEAMNIIGVLAIILAMDIVGHGNIIVALYGARTLLASFSPQYLL